MTWGGAKAGLVGVLSGLVVSATVALTAPGASAKSTYESPYGYERTWNAALRLVRVDNGWKVTENDEKNGYMLFDYKSPSGGKPTAGTMELVRGQDAEAAVSVLVQLSAEPQYHEQVILDGLATKMRREYGDPPIHRKPEPVVPPDAGGDAPAD
ncbi:MAG TPA: hypothetical protein VGL81_15575 [Polyangiaceae bacterium]|jgi:hypothetical protein